MQKKDIGGCVQSVSEESHIQKSLTMFKLKLMLFCSTFKVVLENIFPKGRQLDNPTYV